ncbi:MAG: bifunctional YncE family protein/alkaline phosphatase family protein [Acidobacteriota bacterium]|nr:bifunctional YncE family protein/alkaline phosphatase family protein [Acidobacteriota bacterium]
MFRWLCAIVYSLYPAMLVWSQSLGAPAGDRPAHRHRDASLLPGGRIVVPLGEQHITGAGPFGLALSADGRTALTANTGPGRNSLSIFQLGREGTWQATHWNAPARSGDPDDGDLAGWRGVFMGAAIVNNHSAWVSEGNSGNVSLFDWTAERRRAITLNTAGFRDSYSGDLAYDPERNILYVVDQANFRIAVIDGRTRQVIASVKTGRLPFAVALSPDHRRLYVTNIGMFQYRAIPGADPKHAAETGLFFPAFGFPSAAAVSGARRPTARGEVEVPGLGDPNVREANSVAVFDVAAPATSKLLTFVRTGLPFGAGVHGGSSPCGILATAENVFVANTNDDSITVIDARTNQVSGEIPLRIAGLDPLRGVLPIGLAWHERNGWLLAAEAGINAVAVIDPRRRVVLGHLPAAWFPTRVAVHGDTVFVANGRGFGQGPDERTGPVRQGSVSIFPLPPADSLDAHTRFVMEANGFVPRVRPDPRPPEQLRYVVLIVKENRTFDEVFGDVPGAMGAPALARFGMRGYVDGERRLLSLRDVAVTPNHHALARRWTIGDNFYADSDVSVDGHHWLAGSPPTAWTESSLSAAYSEQKKDFRLAEAPGRLLFAGSDSSVHPEEQLSGGTLWHHLERHGIPFRNFGEGFELAGVDEERDLEPTDARFLTNIPMPDPLYRNTSRQYPGFNTNVPDQYRAGQFIAEIQERYVRTGKDLPRFVFIHLPNDHTASPRPADGYPYRESYVGDNDYALGRIVEFLSGTRWWPRMAVFVTEDDAQSGVDHIDAHRTVLMALGPWVQRGYVTHRNTSFPGLLKTIFQILRIPPLNLFDASATALDDIYSATPDTAPYHALPVDPRIFDPARVRISTSGTPGAVMDRN